MGATLIVLSAIFVSSFLTILGVTLSFWGVVILYITPERHFPLDVVKAANESNMENLERILIEYNLAEKGIYLPPKNLQNVESSLIFIPNRPIRALPKPEKSLKLFADAGDGIFITPPGSMLSRLFERKLGILFAATDSQQLPNLLSKLLVETMGIAESIDVHNTKNIVTIKLKNNTLISMCEEASNQPHVHNQIGCLLGSALACVIAKNLGKPVFIEADCSDARTRTTELVYRTIGE